LWNKKAMAENLRLKVFCASLADVFEDRTDLVTIRHDLFRVIRSTPNLDWLLLTKRPQNIATMLPLDWGEGWPNVWLGTSAEDQENYDARIELLLAVSAKIHFISAEPLIGPLALHHGRAGGLDWVIVGGDRDHASAQWT
jgi:protein gp37